MPVDLERLSDVVTQALLRDLGDEVDLVFRYGSLLKGTSHRYSDLDISYVPVHEATWDSITVMVGDTLCDLYAIHWSKLERMAEFDDISCTILLDSRVVHRRSDAVEARFRALTARFEELQRDEARPEMLRKAQELFRRTGYPYYLLRQRADEGHMLASLQHARQILDTVLHCLMVCNQAPVDTRRIEGVLDLPRLPDRFGDSVARLKSSREPSELLAACETLLRTTRDLLLDEQRRLRRQDASFAEIFRAAYPELKNDLQHILLACERGDASALDLISLHHELMIHIAEALDGVPHSTFESLAEYEQDLVGLGFPDLLPYALRGDRERLHAECLVFDRRLREYLTEHDVALEEYATIEELEAHLARSRGGPRPA